MVPQQEVPFPKRKQVLGAANEPTGQKSIHSRKKAHGDSPWGGQGCFLEFYQLTLKQMSSAMNSGCHMIQGCVSRFFVLFFFSSPGKASKRTSKQTRYTQTTYPAPRNHLRPTLNP